MSSWGWETIYTEIRASQNHEIFRVSHFWFRIKQRNGFLKAVLSFQLGNDAMQDDALSSEGSLYIPSTACPAGRVYASRNRSVEVEVTPSHWLGSLTLACGVSVVLVHRAHSKHPTKLNVWFCHIGIPLTVDRKWRKYSLHHKGNWSQPSWGGRDAAT